MVSSEGLAKWVALNAHNYAGKAVLLKASALGSGEACDVVDARDELRMLRDQSREEHVILILPRTVDRLAGLDEYRLRNGELAPRPNEGDFEAALREASDGELLGELDRRELRRDSFPPDLELRPEIEALHAKKAALDAGRVSEAFLPPSEQGPPINGDEVEPGVPNLHMDEDEPVVDDDPHAGHDGKKPRKPKKES